MKLKVDRIFGSAALTVSVVLALVLVVTVGVLAWPRVKAAVGVRAKPPEPAYRTGLTIDTPADWYSHSLRTLVIIARSECGACQQARPFLKQLVGDAAGRADVVLASPGADQGVEAQFGAEIGLEKSSVKPVPPSGLRATRVPTLVLVDQSGKILGAWEGAPPPKQAQIRRVIQTLMSSSPAALGEQNGLARVVRTILTTNLTVIERNR